MWQPIETAPRDGTEFQAWCRSTDPKEISRNVQLFGNNDGWWEPRARINPVTEAPEIWTRTDYDCEGWEVENRLICWMPLPTPPTEETK